MLTKETRDSRLWLMVRNWNTLWRKLTMIPGQIKPFPHNFDVKIGAALRWQEVEETTASPLFLLSPLCKTARN
ncbi:MAG: hypothetical protein O3A08_07030 [Proteobacteria bacterium]|nr:hypothetical protein [Pseudomonadota bacterium]MDA1286170.1 hypothetical protein [Pseudomonadota bacterium]